MIKLLTYCNYAHIITVTSLRFPLHRSHVETRSNNWQDYWQEKRSEKASHLARVVNAFGKHQETITAINDAIVPVHSDSSVVFPGMPIMAFGII